MLALWSAVFPRLTVEADSSFFDLGGHSLLAVRLFNKIEDEFGVRLPIASIFEADTPHRLADLLVTTEAVDEERYPVRPTQEQYLDLHEIDPVFGAAMLRTVRRVTGPLDRDLLTAALRYSRDPPPDAPHPVRRR